MFSDERGIVAYQCIFYVLGFSTDFTVYAQPCAEEHLLNSSDEQQSRNKSANSHVLLNALAVWQHECRDDVKALIMFTVLCSFLRECS
jgi:hypothetical protein